MSMNNTKQHPMVTHTHMSQPLYIIFHYRSVSTVTFHWRTESSDPSSKCNSLWKWKRSRHYQDEVYHLSRREYTSRLKLTSQFSMCLIASRTFWRMRRSLSGTPTTVIGIVTQQDPEWGRNHRCLENCVQMVCSTTVCTRICSIHGWYGVYHPYLSPGQTPSWGLKNSLHLLLREQTLVHP